MFKTFFNYQAKERNNYIWNLLAALINASEAVILIATVTRSVGITAAGIVTIAFALSNLTINIGKYGLRGFQTTDSNSRFSFNSYCSFRIITTICMVLFSSCFVLYKYIVAAYSLEKALAVILLCMLYVVEAFEDVYLGHYQFLGRLDIASKVFIIRWLSIFIVFCSSIIISKNLVLSLFLALVISIILEIVLIFDANKILQVRFNSFCKSDIKALARQCFPLFAANFLFYYVTNAPKFSIDTYLTDNEQTCFGIIAMTFSVIELFSSFIYQPQLVIMAEEWNSNQLKSFSKRIKKQFAYIFLLTIAFSTGAYLIGCNILSLVFSVDLSLYRFELTLIIIASGSFALLAYTSLILTIMRKQKIHFFAISFISLLSLFGFNLITVKFGIYGISIYFTLLISIASCINTFSVLHQLSVKKSK